jgi:hypothetical protein
VAGGTRERGDAAHERAADADDVKVHLQFPGPCTMPTSVLIAMK